MSTTKGIVGVLIALLGISALNWQTSAVAQAPSGAAYPADGRILLADSASDRARQEAQRREEQRREEEP